MHILEKLLSACVTSPEPRNKVSHQYMIKVGCILSCQVMPMYRVALEKRLLYTFIQPVTVP